MTTAVHTAAHTTSASRFQASTPAQRLASLSLSAVLTAVVMFSLDRTADHQYDSALMAQAPAAASQPTQVVVVTAPRSRRA